MYGEKLGHYGWIIAKRRLLALDNCLKTAKLASSKEIGGKLCKKNDSETIISAVPHGAAPPYLPPDQGSNHCSIRPNPPWV